MEFYLVCEASEAVFSQGSISASLIFIAFMAPVQQIIFSKGASTVSYADDLCYIGAVQEGDQGQFDTKETEQDIFKIKEVVSVSIL
jgi:hypothetical protein